MRYERHKPEKILMPYIQDYYFWQSTLYLPKYNLHRPASPSFAMVFNLGDRHFLTNKKTNNQKLPSYFISGQSSSKYTLSISGSLDMVGVIFKGTAFLDLFSLPNPYEFLDDRIDLECVLGPSIHKVVEKLALKTSDSERINTLNHFFIELVKRRKNKLIVADKAASLILTSKGMLRMDELADDVCLSARQLRRQFRQRMGIPPKYFARIKRFNYFNYLLTHQPDKFNSLPLHNSRLYDQSHFIKDYREFFDNTPAVQVPLNRQFISQLEIKK